MKRFLFLVLLLAQGGWAADWTWEDVGPEGGSMTSISLNPSSSSVLAVSSFCDGYLAQGGVWQRVLSQWPSGGGGVCSFLLPDTALFILQENGQLHRSVDGGLTWSYLRTFPDRVLGLSEVKSNTAYLVANDMTNFVDTLYRSTDAGANWDTLCTLPMYFEDDVAITCFLDTLIFIGGWARDSIWVLKSDDGGLSWNTVVQFSSPGDGRVYDLEWDELRKTLWTCFDPGPPHPGSLPSVHLYCDALGAATFLDTLKAVGFYVVTDVEFLSQDTVIAGGFMGIYRLVLTPEWDSISVDAHLDSSAVVMDIDTESGTLWAASSAGCLTSTDGGNLWQYQNTGLDAVTLLSRSQVSEVVAGTLYTGSLGGLMYGPVYRSLDDGATWEWVEEAPSFVSVAELFGGNPSIVYAHGLEIEPGYTYHSMVRSLDGGLSWTWTNSFPPESLSQEMMISDLWVSPQDSSLLLRIRGASWQIYPGPVYRSTDAGGSWLEVLPQNVLWLTGRDTVFASWDSTWVSYDAGSTWSLFSERGGWVDWDEANQYLYLLERGDTLNLYRYDLGGSSTQVLGPFVTLVPWLADLSVSPQGHVYVSWFDQSFYPLIARSTDLGSTWETDSLAFFCTTIRACSTGVIASELGRGFKRSTDIVGVEEVTSAPSPGLSFQLSPNPFLKRAVINYSLPDQREVTIKVFDLTGRLIRVVERGMRKEGTHRLYWDGKNWAGEEISAGIYFVRLEVSDQEPRTLSLVKLPN